MPDAPATVNEEKARKFWVAYQSCVETHHITPRRGGGFRAAAGAGAV